MCNKVKYPSDNLALIDMKKFKRQNKRSYSPIRTYYCYTCNAWHLTALPDNNELKHLKKIENLKKVISSKDKKIISLNKDLDKSIKIGEKYIKMFNNIKSKQFEITKDIRDKAHKKLNNNL